MTRSDGQDRVRRAHPARALGAAISGPVAWGRRLIVSVGFGEEIPGGYAEFTVSPAHGLAEIPDSIPYAEASICACTIGTAIHVAQRGRVTAKDTVLITGANSGIGRAAAVRLAESGDRVYAGMRSTAKAEKLLALAAESGCEVHPVELDVNDAASVARGTEQVLAGLRPDEAMVSYSWNRDGVLALVRRTGPE